jgi:hypothetical protein
MEIVRSSELSVYLYQTIRAVTLNKTVLFIGTVMTTRNQTQKKISLRLSKHNAKKNMGVEV